MYTTDNDVILVTDNDILDNGKEKKTDKCPQGGSGGVPNEGFSPLDECLFH